MPELPEVETVRRTLAPALGQKVKGVRTSKLSLRGKPIGERALRKNCTGMKIDGIRRIGKYLLLDFSSGASVLVHLGMSGRLRLYKPDSELPSHTHVTWDLGKYWLCFSDPRRFGMCHVVWEDQDSSLDKLGPDALLEMPSGEVLKKRSGKSERKIKEVLLDQTVIAGLGNIYVSEICYRAGIRPTVRANRLSLKNWNALAKATVKTLNFALERGGTSLRDFVAADGRTGEFSEYLQVYGREGEGCLKRGCSAKVKKVVIGGRSTFFCPVCQQL